MLWAKNARRSRRVDCEICQSPPRVCIYNRPPRSRCGKEQRRGILSRPFARAGSLAINHRPCRGEGRVGSLAKVPRLHNRMLSVASTTSSLSDRPGSGYQFIQSISRIRDFVLLPEA